MDMMYIMFDDYWELFTIVFIDDILIYSKSRDNHEIHLRRKVQVLVGQSATNTLQPTATRSCASGASHRIIVYT
jgi:hypothetical protein